MLHGGSAMVREVAVRQVSHESSFSNMGNITCTMKMRLEISWLNTN